MKDIFCGSRIIDSSNRIRIIYRMFSAKSSKILPLLDNGCVL